MSVERKQSLFIIAYPGKETADEVYHTLRALEKQDKIDIKTAATLYRAEDGRLRLKHRRRLTVWKGAFGVGAIGLILAGTGAGFLAGAVVICRQPGEAFHLTSSNSTSKSRVAFGGMTPPAPCAPYPIAGGMVRVR